MNKLKIYKVPELSEVDSEISQIERMLEMCAINYMNLIKTYREARKEENQAKVLGIKIENRKLKAQFDQYRNNLVEIITDFINKLEGIRKDLISYSDLIKHNEDFSLFPIFSEFFQKLSRFKTRTLFGDKFEYLLRDLKEFIHKLRFSHPILLKDYINEMKSLTQFRHYFSRKHKGIIEDLIRVFSFSQSYTRNQVVDEFNRLVEYRHNGRLDWFDKQIKGINLSLTRNLVTSISLLSGLFGSVMAENATEGFFVGIGISFFILMVVIRSVPYLARGVYSFSHDYLKEVDKLTDIFLKDIQIMRTDPDLGIE